MPHNYCILSFDGGGVGGLFTCLVLDRLTRDFPNLLPHASLLAGTSTGGLIALGLASGRSVPELIDLYRSRTKVIFKAGFWRSITPGSRYDNAALKAEVGAVLGTRTLGELGKKVVIPTFRIKPPEDPAKPRMWAPKFFHNLAGTDGDNDELAADVAVRTCSAPTYFPSYQGYIDGGVIANNPSMAAIAQALDPRNTEPGHRPTLDRITLLSIGTLTTKRYRDEDRVDRGRLGWVTDLVRIFLGGTSGVPAFQAARLLNDRHRRIDVTIDDDRDFDDASDDNLSSIAQKAALVDDDGARGFLQQHWF